MLKASPPTEPTKRGNKRQDPAILLTLFAMAIAVTPEFTFLGVPKVRITDILILPMSLYFLAQPGRRAHHIPLLRAFLAVMLWDTLVLLLFGTARDQVVMGLLFLGKRLCYYLVFVIAFLAVQTHSVFQRTITALLAAAPILALSVLREIHTESADGETMRASGIIADQQAQTALFFVILIAVCLGALPVWRSAWARLILLGVLATGIPAILQTGTRGALLDLLAAVIILETMRGALGRSLTALTIGLVVLLVSWSFLPTGLQTRLSNTVPDLAETWTTLDSNESMEDVIGDNSAAARVAAARDALNVYIFRSPLVGRGMAFRPLGFVDNFFLTEWCYNGLIGLIAMCIFLQQLGSLLLRSYKIAREPMQKGVAAGVLASFGALLLATLHSDSFYLIRPMEAFMLLAGLVAGRAADPLNQGERGPRRQRRPSLLEILEK